MKHEIEIPDLPEDLDAVAYKVPEVGEYYFGSKGITLARVKFENLWLVVRKKQPRRIVLEETDIANAKTAFELNNSWTYWKIVEDNKCAE